MNSILKSIYILLIIEINIKFATQCPPGRVGILCQLEDGCYKNPCHANATCDTSPTNGHAICSCPPGFFGNDCSLDKDECAGGSPCEHGGTCVNLPGTFRCDCPVGFSGTRCENDLNECEPNPCLNEATCLDEKGGYKCVCSPGYSGLNCEVDIDECDNNPCQNGASCRDLVNSFRCHCLSGYWGEKCQFSVNHTNPFLNQPWKEVFWIVPPWINPSECQIKDCASKHHNGYCDRECNTPACTFDGGDCLQGTGNPWAKCSNPLNCWAGFKDGRCDQECNTPDCLYDGHDCDKPTMTCDEKSDNYCLGNYANGVCDSECNSASCGWDGGDCEPPITRSNLRSNTEAQGLLIIRVQPAINIGQPSQGNESHWNIEMAKLVRKVSVLTNSILRIENLRQADDGNGTEIVLAADNRKCQSSCYNNTELIAKFINAIIPRTEDFKIPGDTQNALKIVSVKSEDERQQGTLTAYTIIGCSMMILVCALTVISIGNKQKVKEKAVVWFPEGFKPVLSSRNRDPTERKGGNGARGISTLQALGGNFFRGMKKNGRTAVSTHPMGNRNTDIDRQTTLSPNEGGIYHEPYDQYDQYSTYNGTDNGSMMLPAEEPMTPSPMHVNPINMEGPHGMTPLMVAASMGHPFTKEPLGLVAYGTTGEMNGSQDNSVTDLLNRGAQVSIAGKVDGETALHIAARFKQVQNAKSLLDRCDSSNVNAQDAKGRTPLHAAIAADSEGVFELLIRSRGTDINAQSHDGTTPLILATKVPNYSMLEKLIQCDCEVTKCDKWGRTALHWAAAMNEVPSLKRLLDAEKINKDAQDERGQTPLFLAAREGATEALEILLEHKANKDICDEMDNRPIDIAKKNQLTNIVKLLEEHQPPSMKSTKLKSEMPEKDFSPKRKPELNTPIQATTPEHTVVFEETKYRVPMPSTPIECSPPYRVTGYDEELMMSREDKMKIYISDFYERGFMKAQHYNLDCK